MACCLLAPKAFVLSPMKLKLPSYSFTRDNTKHIPVTLKFKVSFLLYVTTNSTIHDIVPSPSYLALPVSSCPH